MGPENEWIDTWVCSNHILHSLNYATVESHPMAAMHATMECASPLCVHYLQAKAINRINMCM